MKSLNILFTSSFTFFSSTPLNIENISKCSLTVKSSNKVSCCGHIPKTVLNFPILLESKTFSPL